MYAQEIGRGLRSLIWLALTALVGCGGGGGGGDGAQTSSDSAPTLAQPQQPEQSIQAPQAQLPGQVLPPAQPVTVARAWSSPTLIEHDDSGFLLTVAPKASIDAAGNATIVWIQQFPNTPSVVSNRFSVGSGWGALTLLRPNVYANNPQVAGDGTGGVIAIWEEFLSGIASSRFLPDSGWTGGEVVGAPNTPGQLAPSVALAQDGTALAVWQQGDGSRINIWSNRRTANGWGVPVLVETNDAYYAEAPQVAMNSRGDAIVVWRQRESADGGGPTTIWANHYKNGVGWATARPIATNFVLPDFPKVSIDDAGNAMAVWSDSGSSGADIWVNQYIVEQGWGTARALKSPGAGAASSPLASLDNQGNGIVLWTQRDSVPNPGPCLVVTSIGGSGCPTSVIRMNLWSRRYTPRDGWAEPHLVETNDRSDASSAALAFDNAGNAVAVWTQVTTNISSSVITVWANRYINGQGWGTATMLQDAATGNAMSPSVAVNAVGEAVVAWGQSDGVRANVWASRLQ